jgi:acyl transferase domain-containing protein
MLGHSVGEYVAACLAGVFTLEEALGLVAARGRLMGSLAGGAMSAVALSEEALRPMLDERTGLAAVNAPDQCAVAGTADAVGALEARLEAAGIACHRLRTSHAFHSPMMDPILAEFQERVGQVALKARGSPCRT